MSPKPVFLLFSGHNDRAVIALCRFFSRQELPFLIVTAGPDDVIYHTDWSDRVIFCRLDRHLDIAMYAVLLHAAQPSVGPDQRLIYCPTTEFMNQFVLDHRTNIEATGLHVGLPDAEIYAQLSGKYSSQALIEQLTGLKPPPTLSWEGLQAPCVLKPRENVSDSKVFYPQLCPTPAALDDALNGLDLNQWFAQAWVEGQSYYLCGYLAQDGDRAWFWQKNFLQQPGGKSMVLACSGENPGLDVDELFRGLAQLGYHGPFMMELIRDADGTLHYIEINPRFWGPLQLALSACPRLLTLFARDSGATVIEPASPAPGPHWYAWAKGAQMPNCRRYPAAARLGQLLSDDPLITNHDVYAGEDTHALHGRH